MEWTGKPLLGATNTDPSPKTTPLGIVYYPFGLDFVGVPEKRRRKRIKRGVRYLEENSVPEHIVNQFKEYAEQLPEQLPAWIDAAYETIYNKWTACGGKYADIARRCTPPTIRITLADRPWWSDYHGQWAASWVYQDQIKVCVATISGLTTGQPWLRLAPGLVEWESGNLLQRRMGQIVTGGPEEIGNKSPC